MKITPEVIARFWEHVEAIAGRSCWLWTGPVCSGSPTFKVKSKRFMATRVAFVLSGRHIASDRTTQHQHGCPRLCVRPSHLSEGRPIRIKDPIAKLPVCRERKRQLRRSVKGLCVWSGCTDKAVLGPHCKDHVVFKREQQRKTTGAIRRNRSASYNL